MASRDDGCLLFLLELRPLWSYRARVSQRGTRVWLCIARAAAWSRAKHGLAPARQVLSLWWAEPYGAVCVVITAAAAGSPGADYRLASVTAWRRRIRSRKI